MRECSGACPGFQSGWFVLKLLKLWQNDWFCTKAVGPLVVIFRTTYLFGSFCHDDRFLNCASQPLTCIFLGLGETYFSLSNLILNSQRVTLVAVWQVLPPARYLQRRRAVGWRSADTHRSALGGHHGVSNVMTEMKHLLHCIQNLLLGHSSSSNLQFLSW